MQGKASYLDLRGARLWKGHLDRADQEVLVARIREVVAAAPLFHPTTASGKQMSTRMTSAGALGWISDRRGYRYEPLHPSGVPWPPIPTEVLRIWQDLSDSEAQPDSCLVNYYSDAARMGMHRDEDEADLRHPVVSVSLGDEALFRIGNKDRGGKTQSVWLESGDVLVMSGDARLLYHGVDRIKPGSSTLLSGRGRLNLTLRVAG